MIQSQIIKTGVILFTFIFAFSSQAANKALVYQGPGACEEDCSKAAFDMAKLAGLDPVYIGPEVPNEDTFKDVVIWLQPGGYASTAMNAMAPELKTALKNFIQNGGGYVGFCAGAFVATSLVGSTKTKGLGIFPGITRLHGTGLRMETIKWEGHERYLYWEGGPYLDKLSDQAEVIANYDDQKIAAARTTFGKGKVFITGLHPEAPEWWRTSEDLDDIDGNDFDLAVEMIHWASGN